jgi:hypothetical protein
LLQALKAPVRSIRATAEDLPLVEAVRRDLAPLRRRGLKIEAVTPGMVAIAPLPRAREVAGWLDDRGYHAAPDRQEDRLLVTIAWPVGRSSQVRQRGFTGEPPVAPAPPVPAMPVQTSNLACAKPLTPKTKPRRPAPR